MDTGQAHGENCVLGTSHYEVVQPVQRTAPTSVQTARETEVLRLVADGLSNPQSATRLTLSEHTAKRHVANILMKLALPNRAAAVAAVSHLGLLK